jgi:hypothetical protein
MSIRGSFDLGERATRRHVANLGSQIGHGNWKGTSVVAGGRGVRGVRIAPDATV